MAAVAFGDAGSLLVLLPGLGATGKYWRPVADSIARDARVLLVDPLGFGASAKLMGQYTMDRHVAAFARDARRGPTDAAAGQLSQAADRLQRPGAGWKTGDCEAARARAT